MTNKNKKKKRMLESKFFLDTRKLWRPGVGIICKRCKCGLGADSNDAKSIESAMKMMSKIHTKKSCDQMLVLNKELEENCLYPCCAHKKQNKKKNRHDKKSKKVKQQQKKNTR